MIKYLTFFIFFLLLLNLSYGQNRKAVRSETAVLRMTTPVASPTDPRLSLRVEQDTVSPDIFADDCSLELFNYFIDEPWGLIGGTNGFFDLEKTQRLRYTPLSGFFVREVWGWFGHAEVVGDGNIIAKVYSVDPQTQGPGGLMAFSRPLKTSQLIVGEEAAPTVFAVDNPLTIRDDAFFAGFDFSALYAAGDTVGLFQTEDGCGDGSDSWELFLDGTWTPINDASTWTINSNFAVEAVVEPTDLVQERLEAPIFQDTCSNSLTVFLSDGWGYVSGVNNYGDREKAQLLTFETNANVAVREIWGWFSDVSVGNDGPVSAKVYALNQNADGPGALLGTSASLKTSELNFIPDQPFPTPFVFDEPIGVSDIAFYASIDFSGLYATSDTVGLWQTNDGCGDGSTSVELFSNGVTWDNISHSWGLEANFLISAVIEFSTDVDEQLAFVAENGLSLFPAFPNPAAETVNLKYQLDKPVDVLVEIYSAEGRLLQKRDLGRQMTGEHTETIDVSALPAGAYVYGVVAGQSRLMSRFVVGR